jgi:hypothetical protein
VLGGGGGEPSANAIFKFIRVNAKTQNNCFVSNVVEKNISKYNQNKKIKVANCRFSRTSPF